MYDYFSNPDTSTGTTLMNRGQCKFSHESIATILKKIGAIVQELRRFLHRTFGYNTKNSYNTKKSLNTGSRIKSSIQQSYDQYISPDTCTKGDATKEDMT